MVLRGKFMLLVAFFMLAVGLTVFLLWNVSDEANSEEYLRVGNNVHMPKDTYKREANDIQSYYVLDKMNFLAAPSLDKITYVQAHISLAYPKNSVKHENDIILHREEIRKRIQLFLSQKTFRQLQSTSNKERLKSTLLASLNQLLRYNITNIYFIEFFVIQKEQP